MTAEPENPSPALAMRRRQKTRRSVIIADKVADWVITVGGLFVIVTVFGIMAFLANVMIPLFTGGSVLGVHTGKAEAQAGRVLFDKVDEYKTLSVHVNEKGDVTAFHIPTGAKIEASNFDFGGATVTAVSKALEGNRIAFGFENGTVRVGKLSIDARVITEADRPQGLTKLDERDSTDGKTLFSVIQGGQIRALTVTHELGPAQTVAPRKAIVAMDYRESGSVERPTSALVTIDSDGVGRLVKTEEKKNLLTGDTKIETESATLPALPDRFEAAAALINDKGDEIYAADAGGVVYRYDARDFANPVLAETSDIVPGEHKLTAFSFLIGGQAIAAGTSDGRVDVFFRAQVAGARTTDGYQLVKAHSLEPHKAAVVAVAPSQRGRMFATADAQGNVWLRHSTSEQTVLKLSPAKDASAIGTLVLAPRENGIIAVAEGGAYAAWDIDAPHPETTLKSIFGKIWYEGYPAPSYTWQSSSGTDSFEPKLSLTPLIFGTLKAALYSLLFAIPIALLAAIYTSEFLHHRVRAVVKPVMEMMASLPSVVLGFIAALILAPIVETWIAAVILAFVAIPLGLMAGAYLWQLLPAPVALKYAGLPKFALMFAVLAVFGWLSYGLGPVFERVIFAGDLKAWANGDVGGEAPFMTLLLFPLSFVIVSQIFNRTFGLWFADAIRPLPRSQAGLISIGKWFAMLAASLFLGFVLGHLLIAAGLGARGGVVSTYVQRNALVVGFAMGFAVIPIIYTIAEDALNSVPEHLRAASLACGATDWQTAVNIVLPTAMSGVFAAIMVGMGRAVGETMIVVMAAGNTPLMSWNIFDGLRALSANIAVELPEAVKDSTLYRMLFLAAFVLFVMTFVINTFAEIVRLRFRRRSAQL